MKKFLLSASMLMVAGATFAVTDNVSYPPVKDLKIENQWILDRAHAGTEAFEATVLFNTTSPSAYTDGETIYVATSGEQGMIHLFNFATGEYIKTLNLTLGGEAYGGTLCCNSVIADEYGHLVVAPFAANSDGLGEIKLYTVNVDTAELTEVGSLLCDGVIGRIDYIDLIGDVTGVEAACTVMGGSSAADNLNVWNWKLPQGGTDFEGGWSDGSFGTSISGTCPADLQGFGTANVLTIVRDGSKSGDMNLFYIDCFNGFPALYSSEGALIEKLTDADLIHKDADGNVTSGTIPSPAAGANGIAEGACNGINLIAFPEGQYDGSHKCQAIITAVDENMSMASMEYLWMVPEDGLGQTSDGGRRKHSMKFIEKEDGTYFFSYKGNNGMAVYKISADGSVGKNIMSTAKIRVNGGVISVSEKASSIEVYNVMGQKVAQVNNASEVKAPAQGAYIVKATVNGKAVVAKVIL